MQSMWCGWREHMVTASLKELPPHVQDELARFADSDPATLEAMSKCHLKLACFFLSTNHCLAL
jgi:hypothetical protein